MTDVPTSVTLFVGATAAGPACRPTPIDSLADYERSFGTSPIPVPMHDGVRHYFLNGGAKAIIVSTGTADPANADAIFELHQLALGSVRQTSTHFNLLSLPPPADRDIDLTVLSEALDLAVENRALLLVDAPASWSDSAQLMPASVEAGMSAFARTINGIRASHAALYFPQVLDADGAAPGITRRCASGGAVAGVIARTDRSKGIWKAPAGIDASLRGISGLAVTLSDAESARLSALGINALRSIPSRGLLVWSGRTMQVDGSGDPYQYVSVRRLALFIEESLDRGLEWTVLEPSAEPLWSRVRADVSTFFSTLFARGAFPGRTPREAFIVHCGRDTMTADDIASGRLNVQIGFAPLRPGEFVEIGIRKTLDRHP